MLSGAATVESLRSNLRATEVVWSERLEHRLAPLEEAGTAYWTRRGAITWT